MILQQNQYHQKFYDPIISNTTEKLVSPKVNQKGQEEDPTSQKSNRVKRNVFIEYRGIPSVYKKVEVHWSIITTGYNYLQNENLCPSCNVCYIGQTSRHLITRLKEHRYKPNQPVHAHFDKCTHCTPALNDIEILASTSHSLNFLLTLEACPVG